MAATKMRPRRMTGRASAESTAARDTYHILGPNGAELDVRGYDPSFPTDTQDRLALGIAQQRAFDFEAPATLTVERRSLFGPAVTVYRVVHEEDNAVVTYIVNAVD